MVTLGAPHRHYRRTDSTNARAKELAIAGAPGGLVVSADEQTSGRGRQGREWFAPPGGALLYTALLRPLGNRPALPLAVPLAVAEAAEALGDADCRVKWPNDVWIDGRKLAGILIEGRPEQDWAVIGAGINVSIAGRDFPDELRGAATSLAEHAASPPPVDEVMRALNETLARWIGADAGRVLAEFRRRDALAGREISWSDGAGTAAGIDDAGHLLVDRKDGERAVLGAGEVHLTVGRPPGDSG